MRYLQFCYQEARAAFRQLLCESTVRIDSLAKKLGACVDRARPYYEARMKAKEVINMMYCDSTVVQCDVITVSLWKDL